MAKLIMTKGLPASGKSTWAKAQTIDSKGKIKRVNKDDLRSMIDGGIWSPKNEKQIVQIRDIMVQHFLLSGFDVIVDDTNLLPKHEADLRKIAETNGAEFEIESFLDVPLGTCIARNAQRVNPVPENTIKSMYNTFLKRKGNVAQYKPAEVNPDLPWCILVDIDGTLAHMKNRSPFEWKKVGEDDVDPVVADLVRMIGKRDPQEDLPDNYIVVMSGRDEVCRPETEQWLRENRIPFDELHMRPQDDMRKDSIVKRELFDKWIKNRYNVRFVLDDRDQVVKMWREMGLKVLQVAEGDF